MKNKLDFYEVVEVSPKSGKLDLSDLDTRKFNYQVLVGKQGTVIGMVQNDDGAWLYDVCFKREDDRFTFREEDLVSTGIKRSRSEFYTGDSVRIRVDPNTGEGKIIDDD